MKDAPSGAQRDLNTTRSGSRRLRWAAQLDHVREVTLLGLADYDWWKRRLQSAGQPGDARQQDQLLPVDIQGRAQLMIVAAEGRFCGVRFREMSLSLIVAAPRRSEWQQAAYLVRAYNSHRFFAFCERMFFSTPYEHGVVELSTGPAVAMGLRDQGTMVFSAEMGVGDGRASRQPVRSGVEAWEGLIFLPGAAGGQAPGSKLFVGKLAGDTRVYPFQAHTDRVTIDPAAPGIVQYLRESGFTPTEWHIRDDAFHAKSKTYTTSRFLSLTG